LKQFFPVKKIKKNKMENIPSQKEINISDEMEKIEEPKIEEPIIDSIQEKKIDDLIVENKVQIETTNNVKPEEKNQEKKIVEKKLEKNDIIFQEFCKEKVALHFYFFIFIF
jgi:hypothetical protein